MRRISRTAMVPIGILGLAGCNWFSSGPDTADVPPAERLARELREPPAVTSSLLSLGQSTYEERCSACHGLDGRGEGEAAYLLYPKPRDFVTAKYTLVSTWEGVPTDEDLFRTISRGMPGSAMPSWVHLSSKERWALVHYLKSLAGKAWEVPGSGANGETAERTGVIDVPPEPAYDRTAEARAREIFMDACAGCHGATGRGDGVQEQFDEKGFPTRPRDFTLGVFKGDPAPESVYRRIIVGMPGTPMPMSDWAHGEDGWHLTHFVRSLSSDEQRERVEMKKFRITASRVDDLPEHPDSSLWNSAVPVNLHLMPLWWRAERPEELTVRALHDGNDIVLQLTWADATDDHTAMRVQDFRDAVAVEFSLTPDPPFFAMGSRKAHVNIWMWKSEREADLQPAFQDLDKVYPNIGIDSYPNLLRSAMEQPTRNALTLESDPVFVTGWGAGNIVSDPTRQSSSEDLHARGFGTLRARPGGEEGLSAKGLYSTGTYRVVFRRSLRGQGENATNFRTGRSIPVAFAVWNGSAGDRDGKKSVTIWQELSLAP